MDEETNTSLVALVEMRMGFGMENGPAGVSVPKIGGEGLGDRSLGIEQATSTRIVGMNKRRPVSGEVLPDGVGEVWTRTVSDTKIVGLSLVDGGLKGRDF